MECENALKLYERTLDYVKLIQKRLNCKFGCSFMIKTLKYLVNLLKSMIFKVKIQNNQQKAIQVIDC